MRRALLFLLLMLFPASVQQLTVFAASSLTEAFETVADAFEAEHPGTFVTLNFGGSSTLSAQLAQGALADVFASANARQMQVLDDAGLLASEPTAFALNRLVVIAAAESAVAELEDLAEGGVSVVLAGPEAPVGAYSREALEKLEAEYGADFMEKVLANLVSEEPNVRQAAAKVELGEADAAIVYATDAAVLERVRVIDIPDAYNVQASYPIAVLRESAEPELAGAFVLFVRSSQGRAILAAHGFSAP